MRLVLPARQFLQNCYQFITWKDVNQVPVTPPVPVVPDIPREKSSHNGVCKKLEASILKDPNSWSSGSEDDYELESEKEQSTKTMVNQNMSRRILTSSPTLVCMAWAMKQCLCLVYLWKSISSKQEEEKLSFGTPPELVPIV